MGGAPDHAPTSPVRDLVIDLTVGGLAADGWLTASSGVDHVEVDPRPRRRRRSGEPGRAVPKGQKHAYRTRQSSTACGLPLAELHVWGEPFGDGLLNRCPECLSRVR